MALLVSILETLYTSLSWGGDWEGLSSKIYAIIFFCMQLLKDPGALFDASSIYVFCWFTSSVTRCLREQLFEQFEEKNATLLGEGDVFPNYPTDLMALILRSPTNNTIVEIFLSQILRFWVQIFPNHQQIMIWFGKKSKTKFQILLLPDSLSTNIFLSNVLRRRQGVWLQTKLGQLTPAAAAGSLQPRARAAAPAARFWPLWTKTHRGTLTSDNKTH